MNLKRIITFALGVACSIMSISADATHVVIELHSGYKYGFLLADKPVISFSGGDLVVNEREETSYAIDAVKNFHFEQVSHGNTTNVSKTDLRIVSLDNATIQVQNAKPSSNVTLVSSLGQVVSTVVTDAEGSATISLPQAKGIYVISVDGISFKFIRK